MTWRDYSGSYWPGETPRTFAEPVVSKSFEKNCMGCHANGVQVTGPDSTVWTECHSRPKGALGTDNPLNSLGITIGSTRYWMGDISSHIFEVPAKPATADLVSPSAGGGDPRGRGGWARPGEGVGVHRSLGPWLCAFAHGSGPRRRRIA